ncbi:ABC transporter substrate-binding protein [Fundicoccus culcitae]|uniref:ABC transporter substrate-binding protein n=1 Tax=Fundicoccus culcitae TaxID=2969821 RepID=A0ABY5P4Y1_9LACT|nr:ABC transporter substrate-binding protein [Fundicoccus culcitae]UUX33802.1 ABC transporter substrate-binding protein [Fundicoccus culcitae]
MKKIKVLLASLAATVGLSALSPLASAQEPVELTFWHAMNGPHQEMITELVGEFNASQSDYVVVEQNQGDYSTLSQSIMASGAAGDLPTIAQMAASNMPDYMDSGILLALDDLLTDENNFGEDLYGDIFPGFLEGVTFDDQVYAIPFSKSVRLMYVNEDLLAEAGFDTIPTTWEEVEALGVALQEAGLENPAMGLENSFSMEVETMARQNGAAWVSQDLSTVEIASETAIAPIQFLKGLIDNGYARTAGEDGYMSGPFSQGETALYIGSSAGLAYVTPGIEENNIGFSTAEIPTFGGGDKLTLFAGNDLGVFATASEEQQAGAVQFMSFLLQPENTARWAIATGYLPITQAGVDSETWQNYLAENEYVQAASAELAYGMSSPQYVGASEVFNAFETTLENIILNDADIQTEMQAIEDLVKGHLGL